MAIDRCGFVDSSGFALPGYAGAISAGNVTRNAVTGVTSISPPPLAPARSRPSNHDIGRGSGNRAAGPRRRPVGLARRQGRLCRRSGRPRFGRAAGTRASSCAAGVARETGRWGAPRIGAHPRMVRGAGGGDELAWRASSVSIGWVRRPPRGGLLPPPPGRIAGHLHYGRGLLMLASEDLSVAYQAEERDPSRSTASWRSAALGST